MIPTLPVTSGVESGTRVQLIHLHLILCPHLLIGHWVLLPWKRLARLPVNPLQNLRAFPLAPHLPNRLVKVLARAQVRLKVLLNLRVNHPRCHHQQAKVPQRARLKALAKVPVYLLRYLHLLVNRQVFLLVNRHRSPRVQAKVPALALLLVQAKAPQYHLQCLRVLAKVPLRAHLPVLAKVLAHHQVQQPFHGTIQQHWV